MGDDKHGLSAVVLAGLLIGRIAAALEWLGNPVNVGIVLGAPACALATGEFRARGGSALLLCFFPGIFATAGAGLLLHRRRTA